MDRYIRVDQPNAEPAAIQENEVGSLSCPDSVAICIRLVLS